MKEASLESARKDIEDALSTVESMEEMLKDNAADKESIRENFVFLSEKVQKLENILKEEGILD